MPEPAFLLARVRKMDPKVALSTPTGVYVIIVLRGDRVSWDSFVSITCSTSVPSASSCISLMWVSPAVYIDVAFTTRYAVMIMIKAAAKPSMVYSCPSVFVMSARPRLPVPAGGEGRELFWLGYAHLIQPDNCSIGEWGILVRGILQIPLPRDIPDIRTELR